MYFHVVFVLRCVFLYMSVFSCPFSYFSQFCINLNAFESGLQIIHTFAYLCTLLNTFLESWKLVIKFACICILLYTSVYLKMILHVTCTFICTCTCACPWKFQMTEFVYYWKLIWRQKPGSFKKIYIIQLVIIVLKT